MRIGFVTALADEARTLPSSRDDGHEEHLVEIGGIGVDNARQAVQRLLGKGVDGLISWGTAGALDPQHKAGALIIYDGTIGADGTRYECDAVWRTTLERSLRSLNAVVGTGFTAERAATTALAKSAIRERFDCAAVDMESSAVGESAYAAGIPYVALRVVVDPADFDIPRAALSALEHGGQPRALPVVRELMRRPQELPACLILARWYRAALERLRLTAQSLHPAFGTE